MTWQEDMVALSLARLRQAGWLPAGALPLAQAEDRAAKAGRQVAIVSGEDGSPALAVLALRHRATLWPRITAQIVFSDRAHRAAPAAVGRSVNPADQIGDPPGSIPAPSVPPLLAVFEPSIIVAEGLRTAMLTNRKRPPGKSSCDPITNEAGDVIPSDGEIVTGVASMDESAITDEPAPVIREAGGDRSAVTGGTTVLSGQITGRITAERGHTFLGRMIALVEGAQRQKAPIEIALRILLAALD